MKVNITESRAYLAARQAEEAQKREQRGAAALAAARAAAQAVLPRFPAVRRAYCFGSVVRPGGMRATSDVDIALEASPPAQLEADPPAKQEAALPASLEAAPSASLEAGTYFAIWRALERAMGPWELDVIELGPDIHFAARVRAQGELIYERADPDS